LISLQDLFPTADVSKLVSKRCAHVSRIMPRHKRTRHASSSQLGMFRCTRLVAACRPGLLLESVYRHVPRARAELAELFPQTDIDAMVQVQACSQLKASRWLYEVSNMLRSGTHTTGATPVADGGCCQLCGRAAAADAYGRSAADAEVREHSISCIYTEGSRYTHRQDGRRTDCTALSAGIILTC
jgi:hypothetical protein